MDGRGTCELPPVHQDSTRWRTRSSSDIRGEDEAEMLEDDVRVDRAVTKEEEESGEFRRESSNMYLSISSKNSSIPMYIAGTSPSLRIPQSLGTPHK